MKLLNIILNAQAFIQNPHGRTIRATINVPSGEFKTFEKMPKNKVNAGELEEMNYMYNVLDKIKNNLKKDNSYAHVKVDYRSMSISN